MSGLTEKEKGESKESPQEKRARLRYLLQQFPPYFKASSKTVHIGRAGDMLEISTDASRQLTQEEKDERQAELIAIKELLITLRENPELRNQLIAQAAPGKSLQGQFEGLINDESLVSPFYQKMLKTKLLEASTYGIDKSIPIDEHPEWGIVLDSQFPQSGSIWSPRAPEIEKGHFIYLNDRIPASEAISWRQAYHKYYRQPLS